MYILDLNLVVLRKRYIESQKNKINSSTRGLGRLKLSKRGNPIKYNNILPRWPPREKSNFHFTQTVLTCNPRSFPGSRAVSRNDKRPFTSYQLMSEAVSVPGRPVTVMTGRQKPLNTSKSLGGLWPPPVAFPPRQVPTPDGST